MHIRQEFGTFDTCIRASSGPSTTRLYPNRSGPSVTRVTIPEVLETLFLSWYASFLWSNLNSIVWWNVYVKMHMHTRSAKIRFRSTWNIDLNRAFLRRLIRRQPHRFRIKDKVFERKQKRLYSFHYHEKPIQPECFSPQHLLSCLQLSM